LMTFAEHSVST